MTDPIQKLSPRRWHWPPRPFAIAVVVVVLCLAVLCNLPAVDVPHPELIDDTYGLHFKITSEFEHGWPLRYARRTLSHRTATDGRAPVWQPWEGPGERSFVKLLIDLAIWIAAIAAAGIAAQYWRSRRRAIWQLDLRDLLLLTSVAALVFAWLAASRWDYQREQRMLAEYRQRLGNPGMPYEVAARVPAWWPDWVQGKYREAFNRASLYRSDGDTDLACRHRHVVTLRETDYHPDFAKHLRQMPGLEALDLSYTELPYFDATRQATLLRALAPLPKLRGVNLYGTNVTDADMAWLAACPRLEVIDLSDTKVGDHGLAQLAKLPRLRTLRISSPRVSDEGCRSIAQITTLEELSLASSNVRTQAGINELSKLTNLKRLDVSVSAPKAALDELRRRLPECKVHSRRY